jgi:hypothetical protein
MTNFLNTHRIAILVAFATALLQSNVPANAGVMNFPGLTAIRFWEFSGGPIMHTFAPASSELTTQLGALNGGSNDFVGAPSEWYDVFYSDANGAFNVNGDYVTIEAVFPGQAGGGLNIGAVDMLIGPNPPMICRADILASFVGMGSNYIAGSEVFAADPSDTNSPPTTLTTMGNTAGVAGRLRVTVGWTKIIVPEPATSLLVGVAVAAVAGVVRRRRN